MYVSDLSSCLIMVMFFIGFEFSSTQRVAEILKTTMLQSPVKLESSVTSPAGESVVLFVTLFFKFCQ